MTSQCGGRPSGSGTTSCVFAPPTSAGLRNCVAARVGSSRGGGAGDVSRGGASRGSVLSGAQNIIPWTHGCTAFYVAKSKAELRSLGVKATYRGEPCVCSECSAHGMTGSSKVPLDMLRGGLELHYKSYHSNEVTGISNLVADTDEDD